MFFTFLTYCFKWLPTPLFLLVSAVFTVFAVIVAVEILKLIYTLVEFFTKALGGLLKKVVALFV